MKKVFLYITFVVLLNISCDRKPVKIKDYINLNNGNYLVVFKEKFPFESDCYKITVTDFEDKEMFYVTYDQHNIFFEIKNYDRIQQRKDTIFIYSNFKPRIRIEEKRGYAFKFVEDLPTPSILRQKTKKKTGF